MGRRLRKKRNEIINEERIYGVDRDAEVIQEKAKSHLSLKDAGVILTISSLLSIILVTCTIGVSGILERLHQNDLTELILASVFFVCLFALLSYLLVKMAAHYIVYLAIATFCGIIFPVSRRKQRSTVNEIYDRANK